MMTLKPSVLFQPTETIHFTHSTETEREEKEEKRKIQRFFFPEVIHIEVKKKNQRKGRRTNKVSFVSTRNSFVKGKEKKTSLF